MLPEHRQSTAISLSRGTRKSLEQRYESHLVRLADEQLVRDRAAERIQGGGDLLSMAGAIVATVALAASNLATVNPDGAYLVMGMIKRFAISSADFTDAYMQRPL